MRRVILFAIIFSFIILPCIASDNSPNEDSRENSSVVFVYHIPDEEEETNNTEQSDEESVDIISDDITADTSGNMDIFNDDYDLGDMYSAVLQGYAEYNETDEAQGINLEDYEAIVLNIKQPLSVGTKKYTSLKPSESLFSSEQFSKLTGSEYSIAPISAKNSKTLNENSFGNFSAGTLFSQGIDTGELEQSSGIFSKYKYKRFSVTTSYLKTINSTNNTYNDNFYITPELELNQYFSLKESFSADTVKRRKKAELILSINPLGNKDSDRMRFEIGASQTYDDDNNLFKSQFKFSTNFKL